MLKTDIKKLTLGTKLKNIGNPDVIYSISKIGNDIYYLSNFTNSEDANIIEIKSDDLISKYNLYTPNMQDNVNHPTHYTWLKEACGIEVLDITRLLPNNLGNAVKYILRAGHKKDSALNDKEKTVEDIKKAIFYLNDYITYYDIINKIK